MGTSVAELFGRLGLIPDEKQWARGDALIGHMKTAIAGLATYETLKGVYHLVEGAVDLGGHLDDLRQKTGLSAEVLQEYGYAAKLGGGNIDSVAGSVEKFARTLQEAHDGSDQAARALSRVGLGASDVHDALASGAGLDGALLKIADRFKAMPDGAAKTALAMGLFGKSGAELIPTLNLGRDGLAKLRQEARELGVVIGDKGVSALDELGDSTDKLKMSLTGLKNQAVAAIAPAFNEAVQSVLSWIRANRELIQTKLHEWAPKVASAIRDIAVAIAEVVVWLRDHWPLVAAAAKLAVADFAISAAAAFGAALGPIGAVIAAVGAAIVMVNELGDALDDLDRDTVAHMSDDELSSLQDKVPEWARGNLDAESARRGDRRATAQRQADAAGSTDINSAMSSGRFHFADLPQAVVVPGAGGQNAASAAAPAVMNTTATFNISGVNDPHAVAAIVDDRLNGMLSDAHQSMRGGLPSNAR